MDRIAAGTTCDIDCFFNRKITFARRCGAYWIGFIREANVERFAVHLAENCHATNTQLAAGTQDAHGDFATIGNQDFPEHGPLASLRDSSTGDIGAKPLALRECLIVSMTRVKWRFQNLHFSAAPAGLGRTQSGMLPCFFRGLLSRLFSRARRAVMMRKRVSEGSMMASM